MASLRVVACYFALFAFIVFYIKKQAFCSSTVLYDMEQSQDLQETFIYSSLWSYRRINGTGLRTSKTSLIQLLLLLSGDIETCPGPIDRNRAPLNKTPPLWIKHQQQNCVLTTLVLFNNIHWVSLFETNVVLVPFLVILEYNILFQEYWFSNTSRCKKKAYHVGIK